MCTIRIASYAYCPYCAVWYSSVCIRRAVAGRRALTDVVVLDVVRRRGFDRCRSQYSRNAVTAGTGVPDWVSYEIVPTLRIEVREPLDEPLHAVCVKCVYTFQVQHTPLKLG